MAFDMVRFERGQVWKIYFKNKESVGHEQNKNRPWLVLSIGKFNKSSGMITCVAITTRDEIRSPAQVLFRNNVGENNVVMCESIRTFDYTSGAYTFEFMGQLSDEVLEQVDVALSIHLGLHYSPITLKSLYDSMEAIVKSVGYLESQNNTPKFTDDDVINFAVKLQDLAGASKNTTEEIAATIESPSNTTPPTPPIIDESSTTHANDSKKKRTKWTKEKCEEFLKDMETIPMKEIMEKWNLSKKSNVYVMRCYVKNLLEEKFGV